MKKFRRLIIIALVITLGNINLSFINFENNSSLTFINNNKNQEQTVKIESSSLDKPLYEWNITWGGLDQELCYALTIDSQQNIYLGGRVYPEISGGFTYANFTLVKFDMHGNEIWNRTIDIGPYDQCNALITDSYDNIYVLGQAFDSPSELVLMKYNSSGDLLWYRLWGGSSSEIGYAIALDSEENILVAGITYSYKIGISDICLIKYDPLGNKTWDNHYDFRYYDECQAITLDDQGNIYLAGRTYHSGQPYDIFLLKLNSSGDHVYNRTWGSSNNDECYDIILDSDGNIYLAGRTESYGAGLRDYCLIKYNQTGDEQWFRYWGGSHIDTCRAILLDSENNIYLGGFTYSFGDCYFCLVKYDSEGNFEWVDVFGDGTGGGSLCFDMIFNEFGNLYLAGTTQADGPGLIDKYLIKYNFPPKIFLTSPNNYDIYGINPPKIEIIDYEGNLNSTWYTLDYGITNITMSGLSETIEQVEWDKKLNGTVIIHIYANDTMGLIGFTELFIFKDITAPNIDIITPSQGDFFSSIAPNFELSVLEPNIDSIWYSLDGGITNKTCTGLSGVIDQILWEELFDGEVILQFFANDTAGNENHTNIIINKETIAPSIDIITPSQGDFFSTITPNFELSILEPNIDSIWYSLNGGITNITCTGLSGVIDQILWEELFDGEVILQFFANDTAGNENHTYLIINKDTVAPSIIINEPNVNDEFESSPSFNIIINEINLEEFWYTIDNGAHNYTITELAGMIDQMAWDNASIGTITIMFYAKDKADNIGSKFVIVAKISSQHQVPPEIPGYNLLILIGIVSIISLLISKKRNKL